MVASGKGGLSLATGWSGAKWSSEVHELENDSIKLGNLSLNDLPYSIRKKLKEIIEENWPKWQQHTSPLLKRPLNAEHFISSITNPKSQAKIRDLLWIADKIDEGDIRRYLFDSRKISQERREVDRDLSKGLMQDLAEKTVEGLAREISRTEGDWRLLACALGFSHFECLALSSPRELLETWVKQDRSATLARLEFEADRLKMGEISRYLNAIPLQGAPKIEIAIVESGPIDRVTRYQLKRLDELSKKWGIKIPWRHVALALCPYATENNPDTSSSDILWQSNYVKGSLLLSQLEIVQKLKPIVAAFRQEAQSGTFENISSGGISLKEIGYLGQMTYRKYQEKRSDNAQHLAHEPIDMRILKAYLIPETHLGASINFLSFLLYCWQDPKIAEGCNLTSFCHKITDVLQKAQGKGGQKACKNEAIVQCFEEAYLEIKPWRHHIPDFAKYLKENGIAQKIEKISSEKFSRPEEEACTICLDRQRNYMAFPCGHFDFCLDCIKEMKQCSTCRKPITHIVKVFKS